MALTYEQLLQHSNQSKSRISDRTKDLGLDALNWKENKKKWSVLEVISHLNRVYELYFPNFEKVLATASDLTEFDSPSLQKTLLGRLCIYSMRPKGSKRKFKMQTFDFFEPHVNGNDTNETLQDFLKNKETFHSLIKRARLKNLKNKKIPTALGEKMKFYVAECFEFLLAHEDRHLIQIDDILQKQGISIR